MNRLEPIEQDTGKEILFRKRLKADWNKEFFILLLKNLNALILFIFGKNYIFTPLTTNMNYA
jgi:hypothetical protein